MIRCLNMTSSDNEKVSIVYLETRVDNQGDKLLVVLTRRDYTLLPIIHI